MVCTSRPADGRTAIADTNMIAASLVIQFRVVTVDFDHNRTAVCDVSAIHLRDSELAIQPSPCRIGN